jgi:hypothetical protein
MGYVERSLADGERIVYKTRLHWIYFVWFGFYLFLACITFVAGFEVAMRIFSALTLILGFVLVIIYPLSEFAVTNRRVIGKLAGRLPSYLDVPLMEIRDVEFRRGLLGNFLNYGKLLITDRHGKGHRQTGLPLEFYRQLHARLERNQRILK